MVRGVFNTLLTNFVPSADAKNNLGKPCCSLTGLWIRRPGFDLGSPLDCSTGLSCLSPAGLTTHPPRNEGPQYSPPLLEQSKSYWWELQCNDWDSVSARALIPEPTPKFMKLPFKWWDKIILFILSLFFFFFFPVCSCICVPWVATVENVGKESRQKTRSYWHKSEGFACVSDVRIPVSFKRCGLSVELLQCLGRQANGLTYRFCKMPFIHPAKQELYLWCFPKPKGIAPWMQAMLKPE